MLVIFFSTILIFPIKSFIIIPSTSRSSPQVLLSSNNSNQQPLNEFEGFNPFEKKQSKTLNPLITSNNNLSLRQLRMKELMNTLLQNVSIYGGDDHEKEEEEENNQKLLSILNENSELILEPLIEDDALMDGDSIYDVGMSKEERFIRYNEVMEQRIEKAVNKSVKKILILMKDFVAQAKTKYM